MSRDKLVTKTKKGKRTVGFKVNEYIGVGVYNARALKKECMYKIGTLLRLKEDHTRIVQVMPCNEVLAYVLKDLKTGELVQGGVPPLPGNRPIHHWRQVEHIYEEAPPNSIRFIEGL